MRRFAIIGALVAVLAAAGLATGAGDDGGAKRYDVVLDNSFGLTEGADLKAAGVRIGKVASLDVQRPGAGGGGAPARALITIEVDKPGFDSLRKDVFCRVEPQSLIGEYFLNCEPGKSREALPDGATIPVEQTAGTIPPDLVLGIMRKPQRERFATILAELGAGLGARGEDLNVTIRRALPALRETDEVLELLAANRSTLRTLTRDADVVLDALSGNREDVARFVAEARDTAVASAERRTDLAATIHKLPAFLRALRPTLADLGTVAREQTPALRDLRASAGDLRTLFDRLGPFSEAARPAVRSLGTASVVGRQAARAGRPTIARLRRTGRAAKEPSTNLRFVTEHLDDRTNAVEPNKLSPGGSGFTGLEAMLQYVFVQAQAINLYDTKGHILKLNALVNECGSYTNAETARSNPERTKRCSQALGPNQPGINTAVTARRDGGGERRAARRPSRELPSILKSLTPKPGAAVPVPAPVQPPAQPGGLLDRVLPEVPEIKVPTTDLLDYLLST
jgi:virulence factor Mce-like protein